MLCSPIPCVHTVFYYINGACEKIDLHTTARASRNSRETTEGAAKPRPRPTARAVAVGNLSGPPRRGLKRPREAGIRAKPQGEHRNATEFARNHSGSIETQRNSRETTAGASKPRPRPTAARAVAVSNQFLYPERKNPIVQALFGELRIKCLLVYRRSY